MSHSSEIHLRQTDRFIRENPSQAERIRRLRVGDGEGGYSLSDLEAEETTRQDLGTVRLVQRKNLSDTSVRTTSDGRTVVPTYVVVAMPGEDVLELDVLAIGSERYEVVYVGNVPQWRLNIEVVEYRG